MNKNAMLPDYANSGGRGKTKKLSAENEVSKKHDTSTKKISLPLLYLRDKVIKNDNNPYEFFEREGIIKKVIFELF